MRTCHGVISCKNNHHFWSASWKVIWKFNCHQWQAIAVKRSLKWKTPGLMFTWCNAEHCCHLAVCLCVPGCSEVAVRRQRSSLLCRHWTWIVLNSRQSRRQWLTGGFMNWWIRWWLYTLLLKVSYSTTPTTTRSSLDSHYQRDVIVIVRRLMVFRLRLVQTDTSQRGAISAHLLYRACSVPDVYQAAVHGSVYAAGSGATDLLKRVLLHVGMASMSHSNPGSRHLRAAHLQDGDRHLSIPAPSMECCSVKDLLSRWSRMIWSQILRVLFINSL